MVGLVAAAAIAVTSQITDVTVFSDRAQVVRTAEVELAAGFNTLRFEGLPEGIDSRGIQVTGSGEATVLDVRFRIEDLNEISKEAWKELYEERDELQLEEKRLVQQIGVLSDARDLLSKIGAKVTHTGERENEPELDTDQWEQMLQLYTDKSTEYNEAILQTETELDDVRELLSKVLADIQARGADSRKQQRVVEVDLEAPASGKAEFRLSYIVRGPEWVPTYDIRVDSEERTLEVKYYALVRQNTGEDWSDVALRLSTANPGLGGRHPELQPWRIGMASPQQIRKLDVGSLSSTKSVGMANSYQPVQYNYFSSSGDNDFSMGGEGLLDDGVGQSMSNVRLRETQAERKGASVVFAVPGACTVESDKVEHRVAVSSRKLASSFRYSSVPKLDPYAYLKAKATNDGEHPFLEGQANVYLDGSFVATTPMDLVAPDEEFWVFLGADESMKVEHKLIKRYQSKEGLRGRTTRHDYEYLITVKNTHALPEEFIVWDQLPISGTEGLEVKLQQPRYTKDTDELKIDDEQRISWFRTLQPGETWEIPLQFYVEAPRDMSIHGLR